MFQLTADHFVFDEGLQIVQADFTLEISGEVIIDESMCLDVGLPSLVRSVLYDVIPNRWSDQWDKIPFFVCGCGDPECRVYSFKVRHLSQEQIELEEIEESETGPFKTYQTWRIDKREYAHQVVAIAEQFLSFVEPLRYQPYFPQTVTMIRSMLDQIKQETENQ